MKQTCQFEDIIKEFREQFEDWAISRPDRSEINKKIELQNQMFNAKSARKRNQGRILTLAFADLRCENFSHKFLHQANFSFSNLESIDFSFADLSNAVMSNSWLYRANFVGANLNCTGFPNSCLIGAKFDHSIVRASIFNTIFSPDALPWLMLRSNWPEERIHTIICEE